MLEEEYDKKKQEEKVEVPAGSPKKVMEKIGFRKLTVVPKDAECYHTYGRGKDPTPDVMHSYMYNEKLSSPDKPLQRRRSLSTASFGYYQSS